MRFVDLFAGIGGFRIALESFGHKCVFSSEIDSFAQKTYYENFGEIPSGDITKIKMGEIPSHDILCGGFPCQPFSISGKNKGFNDMRGKLFFQIIKIAKFHKPKLLFLENVKNLASQDNGKTLKKIISKLDKIGYDVFFKILKSSDFGVPQERKRIYFVCFRKDLKIKHFLFPEKTNNRIFLKDVVDKTINPSSLIVVRKDIKLSRNISDTQTQERLIRVGIINKGRQGERIYGINGYAPTLLATGGGPGGKTGLYLINNSVRRLSPRECANIQGYPKQFIIPVSDCQAQKQFGNSISIPVLKEIYKEVQKLSQFN